MASLTLDRGSRSSMENSTADERSECSSKSLVNKIYPRRLTSFYTACSRAAEYNPVNVPSQIQCHFSWPAADSASCVGHCSVPLDWRGERCRARPTGKQRPGGIRWICVRLRYAVGPDGDGIPDPQGLARKW